MTQTFSVNSSNDIYIGSDGNLAIIFGLPAVSQTCEQVMKTLLGEMVLSVEEGIPYFQTVFIGVPNINQFEFAARKAILNVPDVIDVISFTIKINNNILSYTAEISTIYGNNVITGEVAENG